MEVVKSLEDLCLSYVASIASHYEISDIKELPFPLLGRLVFYLSAFQLNRLHDVFHDKGIELKQIWRRHFAFRWHRSYDRAATIFHATEEDSDPRRMYLERLFQTLLLMIDKNTSQFLGIDRMLTCVHGLSFHCVDRTAVDGIPIEEELLRCAGFVRVLTVGGITRVPRFLLERRDLIEILRDSLRRLDFHHVNESNFSTVMELIKCLVLKGNAIEVSIFHPKLSSARMKEMLLALSEQELLPKDDDLEPTYSDGNAMITYATACEDASFELDCGKLESEEACTPCSNDSGDDLFDYALTSSSVQTNNSLYEIQNSRRLVVGNSHPSGRDGGCGSLTLAYLSADEDVRKSIADVLVSWKSLRKLAIIEGHFGLNYESEDVASLDVRRFVENGIQENTLSHVVFNSTDICPNILDSILSAFIRKQNSQPIQEIHLCVEGRQNFSFSLKEFHELSEVGFHGVVWLDLSGSRFDSDDSQLVVDCVSAWIHGDLSLRHLFLSEIKETTLITKVLQSFKTSNNLVSVDLSSSVLTDSMAALLPSVIRSGKAIQTLNLSKCNLSKAIVGCEQFLESIDDHPSLTSLKMAANRLEEIGCKLLKRVLLRRRRSPTFSLLDLSYNQIPGRLLLQTAEEINAAYVAVHRTRSSLVELNLNNNFVVGLSDEIIGSYTKMAVEIVLLYRVEHSDRTNALADHVSQM